MVRIRKGLSDHCTEGEKIVSRRIKTGLESYDHLISYCEPKIGDYFPDFLVLSPNLGIVIIEVKDYLGERINTVHETSDWILTHPYNHYIQRKDIESNRDKDLQGEEFEPIELNIQVKAKRVKNPFSQLQKYKEEIGGRIEHCHFPDQMEIPIYQIVCFTKVSRDHEVRKEIVSKTPKTITLMFEEDLRNKNTFRDAFLYNLQKLRNQMRKEMDKEPNDGLSEKEGNLESETEVNHIIINENQLFKKRMTKKTFHHLLYNLIPTSRLPTTKTSLLDYIQEEDKIKLLDQKQEKFAYSLGEGHRLVFGVAGSGKTVILVARARYLALEHPDWNILILCYNRLLAGLLKSMLNPQDFQSKIEIKSFHTWAKDFIRFEDQNTNLLQVYEQARDNAIKNNQKSKFYNEIVPEILKQSINGMEDDQKQLYDAILIDEAQDFEEIWLKQIVKTLKKTTNSLLVCCDGIQGIYERKKFYWSDVGIQARGRVTKFRKSYRNPKRIAQTGKLILPEEIIQKLDKSDEFLETKEFKGIGGKIEMKITSSRNREYLFIAEKAKKLLKKNKNVTVLFSHNLKNNGFMHNFIAILNKKKISWKSLSEENLNGTGVLIGTLHATKGLEFEHVFIPEIDKFENEAKRQLLYVGITRCKNHLMITGCRNTPIVNLIQRFLESKIKKTIPKVAK